MKSISQNFKNILFLFLDIPCCFPEEMVLIIPRDQRGGGHVCLDPVPHDSTLHVEVYSNAGGRDGGIQLP